MKILLIHNFYKEYGGEDRVVEDLALLLKETGNEVFCYYKDNKTLKNKNFARTFRNAYYSYETEAEMEIIVSEFRPDVAHVHNIYPIVSPSVYCILQKYEVPMIQTLHNYRFLCPNGLMFNRGEICEKCLAKNNYYYCGLGKCYRNSYTQSFWYAHVISKVQKSGLLNRISYYIAMNEFMKEKMIQQGYSEDRIKVLPNFCRTPENIELEKIKKENYILFIGRLSKEKGILTLLRAVRGINDIKLKIIGEGALKKDIEDYVDLYGMHHVELLGFRSGNEKSDLIAKAKAIIVPSECYENFPTVVLEAFSHSTPVIVSRIGGVQYMVDDYIDGIKYEPKNHLDLRDKIEYVVNNKIILDEMSKNAYRTYLGKYTPKIHYDKLMKLYDEAMSERLSWRVKCKELI